MGSGKSAVFSFGTGEPFKSDVSGKGSDTGAQRKSARDHRCRRKQSR